jgi:hypothetical protein
LLEYQGRVPKSKEEFRAHDDNSLVVLDHAPVYDAAGMRSETVVVTSRRVFGKIQEAVKCYGRTGMPLITGQ